MKNLLYLIVLCLFASCSKEETIPQKPAVAEPTKEEPIAHERGFLEHFVKSDTEIKVEKTTESFGYKEAPTYKGYIFKPQFPIRITAIGGRIAQKGTYRIELYNNKDALWSSTDTLLVDSIQVTNSEDFQYKTLSKPIELAAGKRFLIRYFNENHESVYDAVLTPKYNPDNGLYFPLQIGDIEVETVYYAYYQKSIQGPDFIGEEGTENFIRFRGLVDFKYERVK